MLYYRIYLTSSDISMETHQDRSNPLWWLGVVLYYRRFDLKPPSNGLNEKKYQNNDLKTFELKKNNF